jgi:elongation factor Tu
MAAPERIPDKPHCNVGTIGDAGHGKSTLTAALTRVLMDRGWSRVMWSYDSVVNGPRYQSHHSNSAVSRVEYFSAQRHYAHADWSSHAHYVKSMIRGDVQMDGAILVVSAPDGPKHGARQQVLLARQVGVPFIVVFLNKVDLVDNPKTLEVVEREVRELLSDCQFPGDMAPVIRGSAIKALSGEQGEIADEAIIKLFETLDAFVPLPERPIIQPFLMPIEDVLPVQDRGTVVTGRIERGKIKAGEEVEIVGLRDTRTSVVTSIEMFREFVDQGVAGDHVGCVVGGIGRDEVERGQVLCRPGSIKSHRKLTAEAYILTLEERGRPGYWRFLYDGRPQFFFRTTDVTGQCTLPEGRKMMPGEHVTMQVELVTPIAIEEKQRFAIREAGTIVGWGVVVSIDDPF